MNKYLDFEDERYQKGYKLISKSRDVLKENVGNYVVYVTNRDVDSIRGYVFPKYGKIHSIKHNNLFLDDMGTSINIRDILEIGVKKQEQGK